MCCPYDALTSLYYTLFYYVASRHLYKKRMLSKKALHSKRSDKDTFMTLHC